MDRHKLAVGAIGLLFVGICGWVGSNHLRNGPTPSGVQRIASVYASSALDVEGLDPAGSAMGAERAVVHVAGQVKRPGLYELDTSMRVNDAIRRAGGPTSNADLSRVNLAARLRDGAQIRVPAYGEKIVEPTPMLSPSPSTSKSGTRRGSGRKEAPPPASISLNEADLATLEQLPGVGPATAQKIVEHRSRIGRFTSVDQLLDVKGIGPKKMEAIRPFVRL